MTQEQAVPMADTPGTEARPPTAVEPEPPDGELVELLRRLDTEHSGPTMRWAAAVIRNLVNHPDKPPGEPGLVEALGEARDRFETIFGTIPPGDMTEDEMHAIAQTAYFGMEHIDAVIARLALSETAVPRSET